MAQSSDGSSRALWGDGRILYAVYAAQIRELIALEWPIRKIHHHLNLTATGLTYQQLAYYLKKEQRKNHLTDTPNTPKLENKTPDSTKKFRPGPRLPDPKELY